MKNYSPMMKEFHEIMVDAIPCSPNERWVREELADLPIQSLLLVYLNWKSRFVAERKRTVTYADAFYESELAEQHKNEIAELEAKIRNGNDINYYTLNRIKHGYFGSDFKKKRMNWEDRDDALNAYNIHHLPIGDSINADGKLRRKNTLLYVVFSRAEAIFIMAGNHKSFDDGTLEHAINVHRTSMVGKKVLPYSDDHYSALHRLERYGISTNSDVGDQVFIKAIHENASTSTWAAMHAQRIVNTMEQFEKNIEAVGAALFSDECIFMPPEPNYSWMMHDCDFGLLESTLNVGFPLVLWWQ